MYYPVAVALKIRPEVVRLLGTRASSGVRGLAGVFAECQGFVLHDTFSGKHVGSFHNIYGRA